MVSDADNARKWGSSVGSKGNTQAAAGTLEDIIWPELENIGIKKNVIGLDKRGKGEDEIIQKSFEAAAIMYFCATSPVKSSFLNVTVAGGLTYDLERVVANYLVDVKKVDKKSARQKASDFGERLENAIKEGLNLPERDSGIGLMM